MTNKAFYTSVRAWGNDILYIGYDSYNKRIQKKIQYQPKLYINSQSEDEEPDSYCYDGTPLKAVYHDSIKESKEFIKTYRGCEGFKLYGMDKFPYQFISREFPDDIEYNVDKMRIFQFDIEVRSDDGFPDPFMAKDEVTCLSIKDIRENKLHVWVQNNSIHGGKFDPNNLKYIDKSDITFEIVLHEFDTEKQMLLNLITWWTFNYPDVLSGWYSRYFDVPYIYNRLKNVFGVKTAKKLSPWGIVREVSKRVNKFGVEKEETIYDIYGVSELDYQDLYKKYKGQSSSYALDFITKKHLNKGKLKFDGSLHDLLTTNYQMYVEYNIIDVERIDQLDKSLKFLDLIIDVAYCGKVAVYNDALGTVKYWEMVIYNHLCDKGQQPPLKESNFSNSKRDQYAGAFVKDPQVGRHKWLVSFDLASLYPSIIRQVNIGPETKLSSDLIPDDIREKLKEYPVEVFDKTGRDTCNTNYLNKTADLSFLGGPDFDYSLSGNSILYSKETQSFLSELMEKFFNKRIVYKKKMFAAEQLYIDGVAELKSRGISI